MRKSRFTEEQIALALRQVDAGVPISELCRKLGISKPTFYASKKKCAGAGVVEMRRPADRPPGRVVGSQQAL